MPDMTRSGETLWWQVDDHFGLDHAQILARLHAALAPSSYLEIGSLREGSLELAQCASIAITPAIEVDRNVVGTKPSCCIFQMSSDRFFANDTPQRYLRRAIDLAFVHGVHRFEQLLRDVINIEKHGRRNSVILLTDCMPVDAHAARRDPADQSLVHLSAHPLEWAGDGWKAVALLRRHRPEMRIVGFRAPTSGLIAITNLDPASTVLEHGYFQLVGEAASMASDQSTMERYRATIGAQTTDVFLSPPALAQMFWL